MNRISIIVGSKSDLSVVEVIIPYLKYFDISYEIKVLSAHRQHDELVNYIKEIGNCETQVIIACAGMAAHLPGVVAALTTIPVIGVPLNSSPLNGIDALYSIVQMPTGVPVATMAIGKPGVINAVVFAAKILSLSDDSILRKLKEFQKKGCNIS
ncbi:MAG: 5-(carboxyamino)imidazole ribonucleotide mutase [Candidatus Neomarinimicrobiota bacterium]|nr:MAG: 5-(carboxyamino)imidazole ribonucleotide mutase [Candidatus Neomarinimicrobiota bacterium]